MGNAEGNMRSSASSASASSGGASFATYVRRAAHAGSWYTESERELRAQLSGWISAAGEEAAAEGGEGETGAAAAAPAAATRALISPHAGFRFSGPTAAFAYRHLQQRMSGGRAVRRVFVLGPSHHVHLKGCAISGASVCETPVGDLAVDNEVRAALLETGKFEVMTRDVDEDEHSIEMQLPYVALATAGHGVPIVPIMVGHLSDNAEQRYGRLLAPYLNDPENYFVISSDFCHWGSRFRYQLYDEHRGQIHQFIESMDRQGMQLIEQQDADGFSSYLKETENTICGRHPILVFLRALIASDLDCNVAFVRYAQSNAVTDMSDSSVSYASAIVADA